MVIDSLDEVVEEYLDWRKDDFVNNEFWEHKQWLRRFISFLDDKSFTRSFPRCLDGELIQRFIDEVRTESGPDDAEFALEVMHRFIEYCEDVYGTMIPPYLLSKVITGDQEPLTK